MKPKLILHAGTHKTGTTAIQAFCAANREALAGQGIVYPTLPIKGTNASNQHHDLAHAFAGKSSRLTAAKAVGLFKSWADDLRGTGQTLLISAEPMWRHRGPVPATKPAQGGQDIWLSERRAYLETLARAISDFDTRLVLVFRNPVDFIQSLYIENISSRPAGLAEDFPAYISAALRANLRYGENAQLFRELVAPVECLNYESLSKDGLIPSFFERIGHPIAAGGFTEAKVVRKSASPAKAHIVNAIKQRAPAAFGKPEITALLADPDLSALIEQHVAANEGKQFWRDQAQQEALMRAMQPNCDILAQEFDLAIPPARHAGRAFEPLGPLPQDAPQRIEAAIARQPAPKQSLVRRVIQRLR